MRFYRTETYEIEAGSLEEAEEVWADNGPECSDGVTCVGSSAIEPEEVAGREA